jgi:hypothetical protein
MQTAQKHRFGLVAIAMACAAPAALAQNFDLSWFTVDGGGATFSTGGVFELGGTIGQPDAGVMTGGTFELVGGFWAAVVVSGDCGDCVGDVNQSGAVDLADLALLLSNFGTLSGATCGQGDIEPASGDGDVDLGDLATLLSSFGTICP